MLGHIRMSWPPPPPIYRVDNLCHKYNQWHNSATLSTTTTETMEPFKTLCIDTINVFTGVVACRTFCDDTIASPDVSLLTELFSGPDLCSPSEVGEPHCYVIPKLGASSTSASYPGDAGNSAMKEYELPEVICVTDDIDMDLMEMDGIDLDAFMNDIEDIDMLDISETQFDEQDVVDVYSNVDLETPNLESNIFEGAALRVSRVADDEYLTLGYKKIIQYPTNRFELSDYRTTQMLHVELFKSLGYPTLKELEAKNIIHYRPRGRRKLSHSEVIRADNDDTDTASEGCSVSTMVHQFLNVKC